MDKESENSAFDIWPEPLEIDEFTVAPDEENEAEEDANLAADGKAPAKETEPGELEQLGDALEAMAEGKEPTVSSKAYKGLQKVLAKKDAQIAALEREYREALARIDQRQSQVEDRVSAVGEYTNLTFNQLTANLEDEPAERARLELLRKSAELETAKAQRAQQRQQPTAQPEPAAWEQELARQIAEESASFVGNMKLMAATIGVDPEDPNLDFGDVTETFNQRVVKFNNSVAAAQKAALEKEAQGVRGNPVTTRGANGGEPPVISDGLSPLERGSRQRSQVMRKAFSA